MSAHHNHTHHDHSHDHDHHHHVPSSGNHAVFLIAIVMNLAFTIIQVIYANLAHSTSLLADAGHNFSDVLALMIAWLTNSLMKKRASSGFSYGFKKTTIMSSLTNAFWLILICVWILVEAIQHLIHPVVVSPLTMSTVAVIGILINGGSALLFISQSRHDLNFKAAFWHLFSDALLSASVVVAGVLIYFTHFNWLDPLLGLIITFIILVSSLKLFKQSFNLMVDGVPTHIKLDEVSDYLQDLPQVKAIHDLHIWALSTRDTALTVHLLVQENFTDQDRRSIETALSEKFNIHHTTIQIESQQNDDCQHACN